MKATIIGSDLLEYNDDVKIIEINTNTTIYNEGAEILDYDPLFQVLIDNNITEFHFIYTETDSHLPVNEPYRFKKILEEKCVQNNITFNEYVVPRNSITVPFIEDGQNKFILRQAFDTTALVDDTYCADKFGFFDLMSGSTYIPKTYFVSNDLSMDTIDTVTFGTQNPNLLIKSRLPNYDSELYPELYVVGNQSDIDNLKANTPSNYLLQEFIYSENNLVDNKYSIIRGIDIIYGSNLDVISLGAYKQSAIIPVSFASNEFSSENSIKLNKKSRFKYITKEITKTKMENFHAEENSLILDYTGSLREVNTLQLGDYIRSIDFVDYNDNHAANFEQGKINVIGWSGSLVQSNDTLQQMSSSLEQVYSSNVDTIYIRITTADGRSWVDAPGCTYYIEESGSLSTRFEKVNKLYVGDKLVITDSNTQELTTLEITNLQMEHANMTIYGLDFEPSDLFLVDLGDGIFSVMHNGCWCPWHYCGYFCYSAYCSGCNQGLPPKL